MGKSKSHSCRHPVKARRHYTEATYWCAKCKQRVNRPEAIVAEIVREEFSNHG